MAEGQRRFPGAGEVDLRLTLGVLGRGRFDPSSIWDDGAFWRASNTPAGAVTTRVCGPVAGSSGDAVMQAWGPGAAWALEHGADLLGLADDPSAFSTSDPVVRDLQRRCRGLRLTRAGAVLDILMSTIVEQRVTTVEARRTWRRFVARHGAVAPGPVALRLPPEPGVVESLSDAQRHDLGLETRRGCTLSLVAASAAALERCASEPAGVLERRLLALSGVGPWTAAQVAQLVQGDTDAVPTGDWHLPAIVAFTLAGEHRADDARMLELLEPFRPHRARVLRFITAAGRRPPRRAPRIEIVDALGRERRGQRTARRRFTPPARRS